MDMPWLKYLDYSKYKVNIRESVISINTPQYMRIKVLFSSNMMENKRTLLIIYYGVLTNPGIGTCWTSSVKNGLYSSPPQLDSHTSGPF